MRQVENPLPLRAIYQKTYRSHCGVDFLAYLHVTRAHNMSENKFSSFTSDSRIG